MSIEHSPARQKRIIPRRKFRELANISRSTEYRLAKRDPDFPQLVWMTPWISGYYEDEALNYVGSRPRSRLEAADNLRGAEVSYLAEAGHE